MSIISNTTVLSNFAAIDALGKLRELFEEVYLSTEATDLSLLVKKS